jgi:hypothetical protein
VQSAGPLQVLPATAAGPTWNPPPQQTTLSIKKKETDMAPRIKATIQRFIGNPFLEAW